jgi:16S rRNA (adenine1518-N6/adenine1519-N6)-dimethyltransferase
MVSHKARKRFGQNFLTDGHIVERIIDNMAPCEGQLVIEIGPGQAALTKPLIDSGVELQLIEIDRDLAARLEARFRQYDNVRIHVGDALSVDFAALSGERPFRLVGNLPYNISTPLIFHVLQWSHLIADMHFMLQKEVVERMAALPGSKALGRLSIMCQYRCQVIPLFKVAPESFSPVPKVESVFVRLQPHKTPPVQIKSMAAFEKLVGQAFSLRRKTLRNSLRSLLSADQIAAAGIDPSLRPEALNLQQFADLSRMME